MAYYPNPNGGAPLNVPNKAAAEAAGWKPSMGTYGANTDSGATPTGTGSNAFSNTSQPGGGGGGGGGGGSGSPDLSGYIAAMQASSGFSIKQLEEQKREFDATLEWQKQQWREQGLPELAIKQRAADLEDKKFGEVQRQAQFSEALQTRQQDLDEKVKLGQLSVAEAQQQLAREIQTGQLNVSKGQLGLDTLKTAASLSGPENWIQAANFSRGVAANEQLPGFVSDLLAGRSTAVLGGAQPGAQMSAPVTMQSLARNMGATTDTGGVGAVGAASAAGDVWGRAGEATSAQQMVGATNAGVGAGGVATTAGAGGGGMMTAQDMVTMPNGQMVPRQQALAQGWVPPQRGAAAAGQQFLIDYHQGAGGGVGAMAQPQAGGTAQRGFWTRGADGNMVFTPDNGPTAGMTGQTGMGGVAGGGGAAGGGGMAADVWGRAGENQSAQQMVGAINAGVGAGGQAANLTDAYRVWGRTAPAADPTAGAQDAMRRLYAGGGAALGPQQLEGLTPTERKMMEGGGAALGADVAGFQDQYARSRIGQRSAVPAMAA